MNEEVEKILSENQLRKTPLRYKILSVLKGSKHALSQPEIENYIEGESDRITVYRTLKTFEEKKIIHRVFDIWGVAKFAFSTAQGTISDHFHFSCTSCKHVFCLGNYNIPDLNFPKGFKLQQINLSAQGICLDCAK